jgi:magnesium transporter
VLDDLRANAERYSDYEVQYAYVVDAHGVLKGVLRLRDLVLARPERLAAEITIRDPHAVAVDTSLDELWDFFEDHRFLGVPVVDAAGCLLGVVRRSVVLEALGDRAESDRQKALGIVGGEELRSLPLTVRSRRRLAWLSVNVVLNLVAASVIAYFEDTLQAVIALAVFLPIISDMSGCSGNQAVAVSLRELSLGLVKPHEVLYVWLKEASVGLINGAALGAMLAGVAYAWKGNAWLGLVVGVALAANTLIAVSLGGLVPLILRRLRVDPAVASGPLLTTVTDLCGFALVLGLATLLLERLA